jgi:protein-L-isoaspartate(D-aspartate) O-methyltransferase
MGGYVAGMNPGLDEEDEHWKRSRARLVSLLASRGELSDPCVLAALGSVPRERFVPQPWTQYAYQDRALPIDHDQTISQPYIVALMTQLAKAGPGKKVLEIGTGCGYQAAVLATAGADVYTVEIIEPLGREAAQRLREMGVRVHALIGDGNRGWPEFAPYDAILVTAAPKQIPQALLDQLAVGGRLVVPVGEEEQWLLVVTRTEQGFVTQRAAEVRFVPMTGKSGASFRPGPSSDKL